MQRTTYTIRQVEKKDIKRLLVLFLLSSTMFAFVGCSSDSSTGSGSMDNGDPPTDDEQGPNEVWMVGTSFNVSNLEVSAGTTVTWTNKSNISHPVTSGTRNGDDEGELFDSGSIAPGGTFYSHF